MAHIEVTDANFKQEVLDSEKVTLIDFWATWCMPCQMLSPIIEQIATEFGDSAKVCTCNVDESRKTAEEYKIMSIPAVFIFKGGEKMEELIGLRQKIEYVKAVQKYL